MGKPFHQELQQLSKTYEWALGQDLSTIVGSLRPLWANPLKAIGSGGSLSAAHLAAALHERRTGNLASVCTPLEFLSDAQSRASTGILLLSAGGRNPDVLAALWQAIHSEPPWTTVLCGTRSTPLGKLASSNEVGSLFEYALPSGKDGFLATNSLFAAFTLLIRAYATNSDELPDTLEALLSAESIDAFVERVSKGDLERLVERETVIVLHGPSTKSAAVDVESKLTEAALARVQLADYRNFAHGRHHWLAKRGDESSVLAFSSPEDRDLCNRTLALIPNEIPRLVVDLPGSPSERPLQALLCAFALTAHFGKARGIDPGRPSVPEFGRKLYHLRARRRAKGVDTVTVAIERKVRAARIPSGLEDRKFWSSCIGTQITSLEERPFGAIVFDYDGTLCSSQRRLLGPATEIANQIVRLLENQVAIGIATGRGRSVRKDLQECIPKEHRPKVLIGYYNASDISTLDDNEAPDRSDQLIETLNVVYQDLQSDTLLRNNCNWTLRPRQLTLEPTNWLSGTCLWERVNERIQRLPASGVRVVSSTHSIDVISADVSKLRLIDAFVSQGRIREMAEVLCIGDRGKWPGNDYELLSHEFALSTDEVSGDPHRGWNLAPAGCRGTQATYYYLKGASVSPGKFQLRLTESNK